MVGETLLRMNMYFLEDFPCLLGAFLSHEHPHRDECRWLQYMNADAISLLFRTCLNIHFLEKPECSLLRRAHS